MKRSALKLLKGLRRDVCLRNLRKGVRRKERRVSKARRAGPRIEVSAETGEREDKRRHAYFN